MEGCELLCANGTTVCEYKSDGGKPEDCCCGNECGDGGRSKKCKKLPPATPPGKDHPDETKGISPILTSASIVFSKISDTALWKKGYWREGGKLLNFLRREAAAVEADQSPLNMDPAAKVWILPTGSLYGEEENEALRLSLEEYVKNGGIVLVFPQQHGSDYSVLPTPSGHPIVAYGWRES